MITRLPAVNLNESENNYHVDLAAPGLKKEYFKLNLELNQLSISVEALLISLTIEKATANANTTTAHSSVHYIV